MPRAAVHSAPRKLKEIKRIQMPLNLKTSHPPLNTRVDPIISPGSRVEGFLGHHGVFLDLETEGEDRGESVRELQDTDRTHEPRDVGELRNGGTDYPG